jgi:hypothetical protein
VFVAGAIGARTGEMIAATGVRTGVSNAEALANRGLFGAPRRVSVDN